MHACIHIGIYTTDPLHVFGWDSSPWVIRTFYVFCALPGNISALVAFFMISYCGGGSDLIFYFDYLNQLHLCISVSVLSGVVAVFKF